LKTIGKKILNPRADGKGNRKIKELEAEIALYEEYQRQKTIGMCNTHTHTHVTRTHTLSAAFSKGWGTGYLMYKFS
jgi:hypothetical protein